LKCLNLFETKRFFIFHVVINLKKLAKNKAKDLNDIGIALEIVPLVLKGDQFDYTKFYGV